MFRKPQKEDDFTRHIFTEIITAIVFFMALFIFIQQLEIIVLADFKKEDVKLLQEYISEEILNTFRENGYENRMPEVTIDPDNHLIQKIIMNGDVLTFSSGSKRLKTNTDRQILRVVGSILNRYEKIYEAVKIEGHADSIQINTREFPTNWELSSARATTVVRFITEEVTFDQTKISAVGFSSYHPIHPDSLHLNRRIEFVIRYSYADPILYSETAEEIFKRIEEMRKSESSQQNSGSREEIFLDRLKDGNPVNNDDFKPDNAGLINAQSNQLSQSANSQAVGDSVKNLSSNIIPGITLDSLTTDNRLLTENDTLIGPPQSNASYQKKYEFAKGLFDQKYYKIALSKFTKFLEVHPENDLADNAQYWIAECYYNLGDYRSAIAASKKVFKYQHSNKNDFAQFKLGQSHFKLNESAIAKAELEKLINNYPNSTLKLAAEQYLAKIP